jgi:D-threo-aldose 1-dehydrogenase
MRGRSVDRDADSNWHRRTRPWHAPRTRFAGQIGDHPVAAARGTVARVSDAGTQPIGSAVTVRRLTTRGGRSLAFTTLGFGSAELGNYLRPMTDPECIGIVDAAWEAGLRYFDTAPFYGLGLAERRLGTALAARPRHDYLLASKAGRVLEQCAPGLENGGFFVATPPGVRWAFDYSYDGVMRSYEQSLERLGLGRIDILYVHDVDAFNQGGREASEASIRELIETGGWRALDELRAAGDVRAIGAGVNEWQPCLRLLELVDPDLFMLAGRYTLLEQEPLDTLLPECVARGVGVVVGGPYNSGILAGGTTYNYAQAPPDRIARVRALDAVCRAHDTALAAAALQFPAAHPAVVDVAPGVQTLAELAQNVALFDSAIPGALWDDLKREGLLPRHAPVPS